MSPFTHKSAKHTISIPQSFDEALQSFVNRDIYAASKELIFNDNPFRRPLLNDEFNGWPMDSEYTLDELTSNESLVANRVILSIYEQDYVFLPRSNLANQLDDFKQFYDRDARVPGEIIACELEKLLFSSVSNTVHISGDWDLKSFEAYFEDFKQNFRAEKFAELMQFISTMRDPQAGAKMFLVQMAGDFLVEASAMARNLGGNYGSAQSELFKVIIDECGYGVFQTKHSTMFESVLKSQNLHHIPHAYWQLYLPTSMYLNNYYNYICRDHAKVFRYFGAILQVETAFQTTCELMIGMMKSVFGTDAHVDYFSEHVKIDGHHSRMVMQKIVVPLIKTHGEFALKEIVRGFEESLVVGDRFTAGLRHQLAWIDRMDQGLDLRQLLVESNNPSLKHAAQGDLCGTQMANQDIGYQVLSGSLDFIFGVDKHITLRAGESLMIPQGVLYGVSVVEDAEYREHRTGVVSP